MIESQHVRNCRVFSQSVSVLAAAVGLLVLLGWMLGLPALTSVVPGFATMKPNTAVCFLLLATALWLLRWRKEQGPSAVEKSTARVCAGLAGGVAALTLAEFVLRQSFGIDELLFRKTLLSSGVVHPGRMSPASAFGFIVLGVSLLVLGSGAKWVPQLLALLTTVIGLLGLIGYIFGVEGLYRVYPYSSIALHTSILFALLGVGVVLARPRSGIMNDVTSVFLGGLLARRMIPLVVALPVLLGWIRWHGQLAGLYGTEFGLSIFALSNVITFAVLIWISAHWLNRADERRIHAEERDLRLAAIVDSTDDAIIGQTCEGIVTTWNKGAERLYGYSEAEVLGQPIALIVPPERAAEVGHFLDEVRAGRSVVHFETERRRKDGELVSVALTISPVLDQTGSVAGASTLARDISKRKRAEEALRQSEARLDGIIRSAMDAIISVDDRQRVVLFNEAAEKMFHCPASEALGQSLDRFIPERYRASHTSHVRRFADTGITTRTMGAMGPLWAVRADGEEFQIEASISQVQTGGKKMFTVILRDVTERRLAEQALRASELRYRRFVECNAAGVLRNTLDGRILECNDALARMLGYDSQKEVTPLDTPQIYFDRNARETMVTLLKQRRALSDYELCFKRKDGRPVWVLASITLAQEPDGESLIEGTVIDITARKQAEERLAAQAEELARQASELERTERELRERTRELHSVLANMGEGLVAADTRGRFFMWNPAADKMLGLPQADIAIENWSSHYGAYLPDQVTLFPSDQLPLVRALRGEACDLEMFLRNSARPAGVWLEFSARPIEDENGALLGGVVAFRDSSEAKAAQREIQQLNAELEQRVIERTAELAAANKEMEAFTYSVSHDLRAPLRHIGGFSKILLEDFGPSLPPDAQRHLQRIAQGTVRMGTLVDELLTLSRIGRQAVRLQATDLNQLLSDLIVMLQPESAGRNVEWKISQMPSVNCDSGLVRQVLQNLLSNALKFTRTRATAVIEVGYRIQDKRAVIFVRDNGVGFDMKYANKLFGVFQRLHRSEEFEGTGVGLATVQRILHKHGEDIWTEATLDGGAAFFFTLALHQPMQRQPEHALLGASA